MLETLLHAPCQGMDCAGIVGALALLIIFLLGDAFDRLLQIGASPGGAALGLVDLAQGAAEQVLLLLRHLREQLAHIANIERERRTLTCSGLYTLTWAW